MEPQSPAVALCAADGTHAALPAAVAAAAATDLNSAAANSGQTQI